jgi:2-polyprenyl-3-methyl-5-hydroxy-6-metoxy-1,4-benzoquinol methylase
MLKQQGIQVECLEPDKTLQKKLRVKGYKVYTQVEDIRGKNFDVIYALNVFEHIKDDMNEAKRLAGLLKPGGSLVIYVPAFQALFTSMDELVGHFRRYRTAQLETLSKNAKLSIVTLKYCDPIGFLAAFAFKYLGNKNGVISSGSVKFYDSLLFPISRILEPVFSRSFGKNALLVAQKPRNSR